MSQHNGLTAEILMDTIQKFEDQREQMKVCVGFTMTPAAWDAVRMKFKDPDIPVEKWTIDGMPVYIIPKQKEPMIGWYNKEMMDYFIEMEGDLETNITPAIEDKAMHTLRRNLKNGLEDGPDKGP